MNYKCPPDIDATRDLTVDDISLFQRFQQDRDQEIVDALLEAELSRHIKLCELAILYGAKCTCYWARLPKHPIQDIDIWACEHLEKMGFEIEYHNYATRMDVPVRQGSKETVRATVVECYFVAKWLSAKPLKKAEVSAEWRRRMQLEETDLTTNPPRQLSRGSGKKINPGDAVWASILDHRYIVEVQRLHHRSYLCIFDRSGKLLHFEKTNISYGATFGPDVGDVAGWEERASKIVDDWGSGRQPKSRDVSKLDRGLNRRRGTNS